MPSSFELRMIQIQTFFDKIGKKFYSVEYRSTLIENMMRLAVDINSSIKFILRLTVWLIIAIGIQNTVYAQQSGSSSSASTASLGTFLGAKPTEYPSWFKESFLEFGDDIAEAAEQGKRVMLLFHQDGCPYCNLLVERNLSQKNIVDLMQSKLDVVALNMWGDRDVVTVEGEAYSEKELAAALRVQFTPTLIFFDEHGKPILTLNGYLPPDEFLVALRFVTERKESEITYREFIKSELVSGDGVKGLAAQDFFQDPPYDFNRDTGLLQRPLAVFFEQEQCPNCEILHKNVLIDEQTRELISNYDTIQLNMWAETPIVNPQGEETTAKQWATSLGVNFAPTVVLFDTNGEEVIRSEAYFKIFHMQSLFDYVLSESHLEQPSFQRYISDRADHLIEQGIDVDIWN